MIYFKRTRFKAGDKITLQAALDKFSEEYQGSFITQSAVNGYNLFFTKQISKRHTNYTRLNSRFDRFIPKLVFNIAEDELGCFCRFRLSKRSTGVLLFIVGGIIANIITGNEGAMQPHHGGLITMCLMLSVFILFAILGYFQTKIKIERAVINYRLVKRIELLFS